MPRKLLAAFALLGLSIAMTMGDLHRPALASEDADRGASQSVVDGAATEEDSPVADEAPASSEETPAASSEDSAVEEVPASTNAPSAAEAPSQAETETDSEEAGSIPTEESTPETRGLLEDIESRIGGSIVQVLVMGRDDEARRVGSGFVVGAGYVLTAADLVSANRRIVVVPLATKAELVARAFHLNVGADIAVLRVSGLDLAPLTFAKDGFARGRIVLSAGVWREGSAPFLVATAAGDVAAAFAQGSVGRHSQLASSGDLLAATLIQHNAMIPLAGYGGPLVNNCGEVVGINRSSPDASGSWLRRPRAPEDVVYALEGTAVANLLRSAGVTVRQSQDSCVDPRADAEAEAAAARRELEEASGQIEEKEAQLQQQQEELDSANERVSDLQEQIRDAESRGEEAASLREDLEGALEDKRAGEAELERLRREQEEELERLRIEQDERDRKARGRFLMLLAFAVAVVALIAIIAVSMHRRRSHQLAVAQDQAVHAQREARRRQEESRGSRTNLPNCVLSGETGDGKAVSLKVPGIMLHDGVVIGRSPRNSTFLIDDKTLSREHAKLFGTSDRLCIEDLGTTNGTRVNGQNLSPNNPVVLRGDDVLELGAVRLRVTWKS